MHLLTTEAIRRSLREEPHSLGETDSWSEPQTPKGEQQLIFWQHVKEEIANRNSPLNNRWTPRDNTARNLKKVAPDIPIQGGCKITEQMIEMRLIIRDDADLYETLKANQAQIEERIRTEFAESLPTHYTTEWVPPAETNTPKDRDKFIIRWSVDFGSDQEILEGVRWFMEAGDTFFEVFSDEITSG